MRLLRFSIWATALLAGNAVAADQVASVICRDGDLHRMALTEVQATAADARQALSIDLGPTRDVWVRLPAGASLAPFQRDPVPVRDLDASSVEVQISRDDGRDELVQVPVSSRDEAGLTPLTLIQAQMAMYSYRLPEGCRVLSRHEEHNHARALLGNALCLMTPEARDALRGAPGAPSVRDDCGWAPDMPMALRHLRRAADRGSIEAGWVLALLHLGEAAGDARDLREAYMQLSRTAGLGHASADLMTGIMRWRGDGIGTTPEAAFPVLLPHARMGAPEAQGIVGTMYLTGEGAPVNRVQAHAWCSLAAARAPLMYSDPIACRDAAALDMTRDQLLDARELAANIHNGWY